MDSSVLGEMVEDTDHGYFVRSSLWIYLEVGFTGIPMLSLLVARFAGRHRMGRREVAGGQMWQYDTVWSS